MRRAPLRAHALALVAFGVVATACGSHSGGALVPRDEAHVSALRPAYTDYLTYGVDLARTGYNGSEKTITRANVASTHLLWSTDLRAEIDAQPLLATAVKVGSNSHNVLYVGTENGVLWALDADTGQTVWWKQLGWIRADCADLQGVFGITGTATIDRARGRIYVADGMNNVHALDLSTGTEAVGWPVNVASTPQSDHIYGALTYNPRNGILYAETGSICDRSPWRGRIVAISSSRAAVVDTFYPGGADGGAGIWGMGGASIDAASNDVFVATGNSAKGEHADYGEHIVRLSASLAVVAANFPNVFGYDADFGATPMLYQNAGCAAQVVAKNKTGNLVLWGRDSIASGPLGRIQMAHNTTDGEFIGVTGFSPATGFVYLGIPDAIYPYVSGVVALKTMANCGLAWAWQQRAGVFESANDNAAIALTKDIVFVANGLGKELYAFDARTGAPLWNSGATIHGSLYAAPTVDGHIFIGSSDHRLYAFGV